MSAGSGIIHQEMPKGSDGMYGFQLWINMPSNKKMIAPKYRGIEHDKIQTIKKDGVEVKVISGEYGDIKGPVLDLIVDVIYLDVTLDKNKNFDYTPKDNYTTFCYVMKGKGKFLSEEVDSSQLILFRDINKLSVLSYNKLRFLLVSGKLLREKIAWGGPIVMNTEEELKRAFEELSNGTFIKSQKKT